ncbi:MAG: MHYT domain-containing protein [Rhodospirillaceae bacterium]
MMSRIATALADVFHPHAPLLVALSFALAVFAAYVALELADRVRVTVGRTRLLWLGAAAVAMGGGIWTMHFLAIIGLRLPFRAHFNYGLTAVSLLVAVAVTAAGLYVAFWRGRRWPHYLAAGAIMGAGVAAMHYVGMAALEIPIPITYVPATAALSVVIAVVAATAALWLAVNVRGPWPRVASAAVMGLAVTGMHFTGMAAFICSYEPGAALIGAGESQPMLDTGVVAISLALLMAGLGLVYADRRAREVGQITLAQFGVGAIAAGDLDEVFFKALALMCKTLGVRFAVIKEIDLGSGQVRCLMAGANGLRDIKVTDIDSYANRPLLGHAFAAGAPLQRLGLDAETQAELGELFAGVTIAANLAVVNRPTDNAILVSRVFSDEERLFSDAEIVFLRDLGDLLAVFKSRDLAMQRVELRDRALAAIAQGVTITDEQTLAKRVIYANKAFLKMTGYTIDRLLAPQPPEFIVPDSSPGMAERLSLDGAKLRPTLLEARMLRADGSNFPCRVLASPIVNRTGDLTHYVWINEDVTESRRRNEKLREMQRTETLGQLTGGIAHEFNNLLAVVRSNAEDLREDLKEQALLRRQADMVVQAADRGAALVQQLLTYSRKKEIQPEVVEVPAVLADFEALLAKTLGADIAVKVVTAGNLPAIKVDPGQLEDALLALALNGRDAMEQGGTLTVEVARAELDANYAKEAPGVVPGNYVLIAVTDTGVGMTPEVMKRAFDPFFTTKEVGKGTGLGLSMVYGFVKQSGGYARLYSEPGLGTTVKLYLPAVERDGEAGAAPAAEVFAGDHAGARILLVEDNDLLRQSVGGKLERLGYSVVTAETGALAITVLEEGGATDLVLTDVIMPGMTGADLAREVQRRWPRTRILMTSGYTAAAVVGKVKMPPGVRLLSKPYTNAQLSEAVQSVLSEPAAAAEAEV